MLQVLNGTAEEADIDAPVGHLLHIVLLEADDGWPEDDVGSLGKFQYLVPDLQSTKAGQGEEMQFERLRIEALP
jgi:hypothetical protein